MRWCLLILFCAVWAEAQGMERCYTSESDWTTTIIDDGTGSGTLVKTRNGQSTVMVTMSAGTGLGYRQAVEEDGTAHSYRFVDDILIMDMKAYTLGCPGGRSWIDETCSRVLISQVDAYARTALFYFVEPEHPITTCEAPAPFKQGTVVDLQCSSGKTLQMDATDYPMVTVDGIEMLLYGGALPCRARGTSP
jgi:hypothetical protein